MQGNTSTLSPASKTAGTPIRAPLNNAKMSKSGDNKRDVSYNHDYGQDLAAELFGAASKNAPANDGIGCPVCKCDAPAPAQQQPTVAPPSDDSSRSNNAKHASVTSHRSQHHIKQRVDSGGG